MKQIHRNQVKNPQKYILFILIAVVGLFYLSAQSKVGASLEIKDKLQQVDDPDPLDVLISSPREERRQRHSTVVNELMARITSALSAVSGDDQAILLADTSAVPNTSDETPVLSTSNETSTIQSSPDSDECQGTSCNSCERDEESDECRGLIAGPGRVDDRYPSEARVSRANLTDSERLAALQGCLESKLKHSLRNAARNSMELFEKLSLSGGCSSSLISLLAGLQQVKSFAMKFLDASAKIPSGVMYGLLSDFGDFDQCLSIRSNKNVPPELEVEEGAFSGKYCLLSARLNYHIQLAPNSSAPEGIYEDGLLWDELVRTYWTTNSTKGIQTGVCVPSRCSNEDLEQLYRAVAESYNVIGKVIACQDSNDLRLQLTPDLLQRFILCSLALLLALTLVGSALERYRLVAHHEQSLAHKILLCFSLQRNWALFMSKQDVSTVLAFGYRKTSSDHRAASEPAREVTRRCNFADERTTSTLASSSSSADSTISSRTEGGDTSLLDSADAATTTVDQAFRSLTVVKSDNEGEERDQPSENHPQIKLDSDSILSHLSGFKLFVIVWITIGHSFLYPSANNYQYYRSIINMNITRDSVWFATTNFTLGIDMLLYMSGLVFVYKLAQLGSLSMLPSSGAGATTLECSHDAKVVHSMRIFQQVFKKILRFWPTYLTVIAISLIVPLMGDGPMWPEMVTHRLGDSCRRNWWSNLLIVNNFFDQSEICLPSSWFVSVLMQLFIIASMLMLVVRLYSITLAVTAICMLIFGSSSASFLLAYKSNVSAPVIKMDESFVLELDNNIFRLYTNLLNNMGPFLIGMLGGFILVRWQTRRVRKTRAHAWCHMIKLGVTAKDGQNNVPVPKLNDIQQVRGHKKKLKKCVQQILLFLCIGLIAVLVLSSVFYKRYTRIWSAVYWSCHRVGWAIVTGYIIHQCATGRWRLLNDLCSLSHFIPLSRLIFIAYLVFPIFIHVHSGFVRDGLHVSIYNMMNIYITRLVLSFSLALAIHLLVELPSCSIEALLLARWTA